MQARGRSRIALIRRGGHGYAKAVQASGRWLGMLACMDKKGGVMDSIDKEGGGMGRWLGLLA